MLLQQQLMLFAMGKIKATKEIKKFLKELKKWHK